jgi:outer membrane protein OmpA-like peptidoglycan-associated protein
MVVATQRPRAAPGRAAIATAIAALLCALTRAVGADPTPSLALEPAPAGDAGITVERAGVRGHLIPSARLAFEYAHEPLVLTTATQEIDTVVAQQLWLHTLVSLPLWHRVLVHLDVPVSQDSVDETPASATAPRPSGDVGLGDLRLGARLKLLGTAEESPVRAELAITSAVWLPTAAEGYAGDGEVRARGGVAVEASSARLYGAFAAGVRTRPSEQLPGVVPTRVGTSLPFGLAAGFFADAQRQLALGSELSVDLTVGADAKLFDPRATVAHLLGTARYRVQGGPLELGAGFGPGIGKGAGSAAFRLVFFVGFAPERAPPPPDEDDDGVPDKSDACVELAGVSSNDPLLHGCPEPAADRDGDAIPDDHDACPTVAGEATMIRRTHGCPKPIDTDDDGVPDESDACPQEFGERPPDGNGCPKPAAPPAKTELVQEQIVLSQQVQFETGTAVLRPESDAVLTEVARVFSEHPELELVEVQGHTDETGTPDLNRRLGQERAERVVTWLVDHGVARNRMVAKGYGSDRPIAENTTEAGRYLNRRVEFRATRVSGTKPPENKP